MVYDVVQDQCIRRIMQTVFVSCIMAHMTVAWNGIQNVSYAAASLVMLLAVVDIALCVGQLLRHKESAFNMLVLYGLLAVSTVVLLLGIFTIVLPLLNKPFFTGYYSYLYFTNIISACILFPYMASPSWIRILPVFAWYIISVVVIGIIAIFL